MNNEEIRIVWQNIRKAVAGQGIYKRNRYIDSTVKDLWYKYGVQREDIVQETLATILNNDVMDRLEDGKSNLWFIVGVVDNVLKNIRRREEIKNSRIVNILKELNSPSFSTMLLSPSPEELYLQKEKEYIINNNASKNEILYLEGEIDMKKFMELEGIHYKAAEKRIKRLKDKLLKILNNSGYDKLF